MESSHGLPKGPLSLVEKLLCNLPGVVSTKIRTTPEGSISEIHVLTTSDRQPKQTVRDVESALLSGFNIRIDHKKISVAQIKGPLEAFEKSEIEGRAQGLRTAGRIYPEARPRLKLIKVEVMEISGVKSRAEVTLSHEGNVYKGTVEDASTMESKLRMCARATLSALENFMDGDYALTLENLRLIGEGLESIVVVTVGLRSTDSTRSYVGACFMGEDRYRSAASASLDAMNRLLTHI
ncbi:MAG: hypothetical protein ACE5OP_12345 [Candidatus Glassbacteria bacterium]